MSTIKSILLILTVFLITGCNAPKDTRPYVVSTTGMIDDIVKAIGQDVIRHEALMGPGVDPHLYKASAGDVKRLTDAHLILYNGLHLEAKMIEIFEKMSSTKPTVAVTKDIPRYRLLSSQEYRGFHDPHVWFDVSLWMEVVKVIADSLIQLDPSHQAFFEKNRDNYLIELVNLNQWVISELDRIDSDKRILVTAHDAFGYFGKAYKFKVVGLQGISTASEASTKDLQRVAEIVIKEKVPSIFIESSVPIRYIKALQEAVKKRKWDVEIGEELFTDAMGNPMSKEGTYIGMIRHNIQSIVNGLTR